jgi:hypothetical protein
VSDTAPPNKRGGLHLRLLPSLVGAATSVRTNLRGRAPSRSRSRTVESARSRTRRGPVGRGTGWAAADGARERFDPA